jgi:predicted SAM-dependent methyltransferase
MEELVANSGVKTVTTHPFIYTGDKAIQIDYVYLEFGSGFKSFQPDADKPVPIKIDIKKETLPDIVCDLSKPLPFKNNCVDEIISCHFIEHLTYEQGNAFFDEIKRILKTGGVLQLIFPDILEGIQALFNGNLERTSQIIWGIDDKFVRHNPMGKFYQMHKSGYSVEIIKKILEEKGFETKQLEKNEFYGIMYMGFKK